MLSESHHNLAYKQPSVQPQSFPTLSADMIIASLHELGVPGVTEDLLKNPENYKEQVRRVMEHLAELCVGISREEMAQPAFAGLGTLSYPELHEESIPQLNSFRACSKMMEVACVQKFGMKDMMEPSAKRLMRQLSGIINFARFREEKLALLEDLENSKKENINKKLKLQEKHEALSKRLSALRSQAAEENEMISRTERECNDVENKISTLNMKQVQIREDIANSKALNNDLKDEIATRALVLEEQSALKKKLGGQIVSSPEKFRKQIIDVGQALVVEQNDSKVAEKKIRELGVWIVNVDEAQKEVSLALSTIGELRAEVEKEKAITNEIDLVQQKLHSKRQALQELDQNIHILGRQTSRADEKLTLIRKQTTSRDEETRRAVEDLRKQLVEAEAFRQHAKSKADRAEGDASRLEREVEIEAEGMVQEMKEMVTVYKQLERQVVSHLQSLRGILESNDPTMIENSV